MSASAEPDATAAHRLFRRHLRFVQSPGSIRGELADDFHGFAVTLDHADGAITRVSGSGLRTPWTTCRLAPTALGALVGLPLQACVSDFIRQTPARAQCTHLFELAALAASHALRPAATVDYAIEVPYPLGCGAAPAKLRRDGRALFEWVVTRPGSHGASTPMLEHVVGSDTIVAPEPFAGRAVRTLLPWARDAFDAADYDAVYILRRAVGLSAGRLLDLDAPDVDIAALLFKQKLGDCFTFQPEHAATTRRIAGSTIDFTDDPDALLPADR